MKQTSITTSEEFKYKYHLLLFRIKLKQA